MRKKENQNMFLHTYNGIIGKLLYVIKPFVEEKNQETINEIVSELWKLQDLYHSKENECKTLNTKLKNSNEKSFALYAALGETLCQHHCDHVPSTIDCLVAKFTGKKKRGRKRKEAN